MNAEHDHASCDYCGLPVRPARKPTSGPRYCCLGCRFASAVAQEKAETGHLHWTMARLGFSAFFAMNVMAFSMVLWTHDIYNVDLTGRPGLNALDQLFRYACLVFSVPVLFLLGGPLWDNTRQALAQRTFTTDLLLLLGVLASYGYSMYSVFSGVGHIYFEVGCVTLVAVTLGRWLEANSKWKTTQAIESLTKLLPDQARLVVPDGETQLPLSEVRVDQIVRVLPGERIPLDGIITRGQASVDEQIWTGESVPVIRGVGEIVRGGTLDLDGDLLIQVTAPSSDSALVRLAAAVRAAATAKGKYQQLADRIAAWFTPAVACLAIGAVVVHTLLSNWTDGLMAGLAVLLIACPCALGLATPMAVWSALGRAARQQVLFRNGDAVAQLAQVRAIAFDKTGTLTTGHCEVECLLTEEHTDTALVRSLAVQLASGSTHPLSQAICQFLAQDMAGGSPTTVTIPGRGVTMSTPINGQAAAVYLGSLRLMEESGCRLAAHLAAELVPYQQKGMPLACLGWNSQVQAIFIFRERLRPQVIAALTELRSREIHVAILTGDYAARADQLGSELDVETRANLLPEGKTNALAELRSMYGPVAMVGDGINDAPALMAADVGMALGCGADISRDSASVCLLGNDLARVPWAVDLARSAVRTIRWNLFWAFAYNIVGITLAVCGWLNPVFAAFAMTASSIFVVTNSLRLGAKVAAAQSPGDANSPVVEPQLPAKHWSEP